MALNSKICKLKISLSDVDRNHYDTLSLTVAQHPSETTERMMVRVLVFCINAQERLEFTKGLSTANEPDLWVRSLDGQLISWIDVGEPSLERVKKASRIANEVKVYCFNRKSNTWWDQGREQFAQLKALFYRFEWESVQAMARLQQRTMQLSVSISDNSAYIATELGECEVGWQLLSSPALESNR
jgi:uncharacterized protein YaeQ